MINVKGYFTIHFIMMENDRFPSTQKWATPVWDTGFVMYLHTGVADTSSCSSIKRSFIRLLNGGVS